MASKQPAHRVLTYALPAGESYVDIARDLSKINRRLYRQGMQYAVQKIEYSFNGNVNEIAAQQLTVYTAGDTWVVMNAWKKAYAHWIAQQRRARRLVGQSAKPTWEDFKVYLDDTNRTGANPSVIAGDGGNVGSGEWDYSRLLYELDDNSIEEWYLHLIGGDVGATDRGMILGYQQSRATVQPEDPDLPNEFSSNMYAQMAKDVDDVADQVAENMEDENDQPPYDHDDYCGNDTNSDRPWLIETQCASVGLPNATLDGFIAQCGLLLFNNVARDAAGNAATAPVIAASVYLAPGGYKGVAAISMGQ